MQPEAVLDAAASLAELLSKEEWIRALHGFELYVTETTGYRYEFFKTVAWSSCCTYVRIQTATAKYVKSVLAARGLDILCFAEIH